MPYEAMYEGMSSDSPTYFFEQKKLISRQLKFSLSEKLNKINFDNRYKLGENYRLDGVTRKITSETKFFDILDLKK